MAGQLSHITSGFDVQNIASLRGLASGTKSQKNEALETIAREFESLFFNLIAKSMNEATKTMKSDLLDNRNIELFQEMLFTEVSRDVSSRNGLGVAEWLKSIEGISDKASTVDESV
jgi:flagellar protein FlgJ